MWSMENRLQAFLEARQWEEAWAEFQRLHQFGQITPRLLLQGSHAAFGRRDLWQARQLAEAALHSSDSPAEFTVKVRFHLGMVAREQGDSTLAFEQFNLFLAALPSAPALAVHEGLANFYLALTLRQRGELESAAAWYRRAILCFEQDGNRDSLCKALQNLAWTCCLMDDPTDGRLCLRRAAEVIQDPDDEIHQTLGEAFLAVTAGEFGLATALCQTLRGKALSAEEKAQAAWIAALAAMEQGDSDRAWSLSGEALIHGAEAKDARLINDASSLRRRLQLRKQAG